MRVTVILSESEGRIFDAYCKKNGFKKSTLISRLIREHIENENFHFQEKMTFADKTSREGNKG